MTIHKLALALSLALLGANLSACAKPATDTSSTHQSMREQFYELSKLDLSKVGTATQIALDDVGYLMIINDKGEL